MKNKMYQLIVLDVDGTLLAPDNSVRPRVYNTIQTVKRIGCRITLATGRFLNDTRALVESLGITTPLILHAGALIQDPITEEVFYENLLTSSEIGKVVDTLISFRWQPVMYDINGHFLTGPIELDPSPDITQFIEARQLTRRSIQDLLGVKKALGISVFAPNDNWGILQKHLEEIGVKVLIHRPGPGHPFVWYQLEIFPSSCSKGQALAVLIKLLGLPQKDVLAIGDSFNDIEMLRESGMGIAMGNAPDIVKQLADAVVGTNEQDGVAEALEKYVLHKSTTENSKW